MSHKILFIGAGNMGAAILSRCLDNKTLAPSDTSVFDKETSKTTPFSKRGVKVLSNLLPGENYDAVILAVKPKDIDSVLKQLASAGQPVGTIISIAAGITIDSISSSFGNGKGNTGIARVMPNMNALIGASMSAIAFDKTTDEKGRSLVRAIFTSVGEIVEVDESKMNAVTGLSGSGPAFVFMFIQALADGGVKVGLTREESLKLAIHTVLGSAQTVATSGLHPEVLKDMIASPGGTTIEGISSLEHNKFRFSVMQAVEAAKKKADSMGGK